MVFTKDHKTRSLFDQWSYLGPKRRKLMDRSWAGLFRKEILPDLPVDRIAPAFRAGFGRPTKELYTALGVLILQQMHDYSDDETVQQMSFNLQWHYGLDIADESDDSKYISPKTLWNFRSIVMERELDGLLFNLITDKLAKVFSVNSSRQRIDSVHITSNMGRLGRIGIFARSIRPFLVNLKRHHRELFDALPSELVERYFKKEAINCFSMVKPSESAKTLSSVSSDLFTCVQRFQDNEAVTSMSTYKLLTRVLREQCKVEETTEGKVELSVKPSKEVPSDSLQNPSDPDAAYSGHKGQGYQVQVMESYTREDEEAGRAASEEGDDDDPDDKDKPKKLNLITHVQVEPANESDAHALLPAIESAEKRGLAPKELLADSLYGSDENVEKAKAAGVEVISPVMGSNKGDGLSLADFETSATGEVTKCPEGEQPIKRRRVQGRHSVAFNSERCLTCARLPQCRVKAGTKYHYLRYTDKELRIALRRAAEEQPEFKDRYRYRAGVEGTMSYYDRLTGVKGLRVRGIKAVRYSAILKAIGVNIYRAAAVRKADTQGIYPFSNAISMIKEQLRKIVSPLQQFYDDLTVYHYIEPEWNK